MATKTPDLPDRARLRRIAEIGQNEWPRSFGDIASDPVTISLDPPTVLALLDAADERDAYAQLHATWKEGVQENAQLRTALTVAEARATKLQALYDRMIVQTNQAERERDAANQRLGNLLARIHRDGGHRQGEIGTEEACIEADAIVSSCFAERDAARAQCQTNFGLARKCAAEAAAARAERDELASIRTALVKALCRATGNSVEQVRDAPLGCAVDHEAENATLRARVAAAERLAASVRIELDFEGAGGEMKRLLAAFDATAPARAETPK